MQDKIAGFWKWFEANNYAFLFTHDVADDVREKLVGDLITELHKYNERLFFQVGGAPHGDQELIITAEGDIEQFDAVEELVAQAPELKNWRFIALIQPENDDNTIQYDGIAITRSQLWFIPLQSNSDPSSIGIRIGVAGYDTLENRNIADMAVFKMLDTVLGEKSLALDIDYLDITELPEDPQEKEMINLTELPAFIAWKKEKLNRP